jgi:hypothetical protein
VQKAAYSSVRVEYLKSTSEGHPNKLALKILFEQPLGGRLVCRSFPKELENAKIGVIWNKAKLTINH